MFVPKNLEDLKRMVEQRLEETARLEFKRQLPEAGKNDDLAKDLAAMANTEGGVIIYGIEQDDMGRAKELRPFVIQGVGERITLVAQSCLDEPLTLASVHSIASEERESLGFLVVEVPQSDRAPHFHQGAAWGRTAKGNAPLTRRRIGELFARSPGFAQEFGVAVGRPGRVLAKQVAESYQETDVRGRLRTNRRYYLVFENDGDTDVFDVTWEWVPAGAEEAQLPSVLENPFPLERLQAGLSVRIQVVHSVGEPGDLKVRTRWWDTGGKAHDQTWPITY
jgi:hypothetical protein